MSSYKFRILIDTDENEEIFRDIVISKSDNFEIFYQSIMAAFDFDGIELASFYISNDDWDKGHEIALIDMELNKSLNSPSIMKETMIQDMVTSSNQKFILVYDFLRMWCFLIELVEELEENFDSPMLNLSIGDAPLEGSKKIALSGELDTKGSFNLGNDIDDIFSDSPDEDDFGGFDNIDDFDI